MRGIVREDAWKNLSESVRLELLKALGIDGADAQPYMADCSALMKLLADAA